MEIIRIFRVKLIRNADEPDIMGRKITLNVISRVNGIASQARQILDDHTAYFAGFNIRKHPLEAVTVEIRSCCSIVDINVIKTQFRFSQQEFFENQLLRFDRISTFIVILHRQPDIQRRADKRGSRHGSLRHSMFSALSRHFRPPSFPVPA